MHRSVKLLSYLPESLPLVGPRDSQVRQQNNSDETCKQTCHNRDRGDVASRAAHHDRGDADDHRAYHGKDKREPELSHGLGPCEVVCAKDGVMTFVRADYCASQTLAHGPSRTPTHPLPPHPFEVPQTHRSPRSGRIASRPARRASTFQPDRDPDNAGSRRGV